MKRTTYLWKIEDDTFKRHCRLSKALTDKPIHIFDVGGNVGQSISRYRDVFPSSQITSFEPNPSAYAKLSKFYGNTPGILVKPIALSSYTGKATLHVTKVSGASSLLTPSNHIINLSPNHSYDFTPLSVPTSTLDDYCLSNNISHIDILKLDTQGSELDILTGSTSLLKEFSISMIYTEIILADTYLSQPSFNKILSTLNAFNYSLWDIGSFLYTKNDRLWAVNATFLSPSASSLIESIP